jgi:hypothetical protein
LIRDKHPGFATLFVSLDFITITDTYVNPVFFFPKAYALGMVVCLPIFYKITVSIPEEKKKPDAHH